MENSRPQIVTVDLEPVGRRVQVASNLTLLAAARSCGVELASVCGGEGWCGKCRLRLFSGTLTPLTPDELSALSQVEIESGLRLACQACPLTDVKLDIPPESLTTRQRLQIEGEGQGFAPGHPLFEPPVIPREITLTPPTLADLRSDWTRLKDGLESSGVSSPVATLPILKDISTQLRLHHGSLRLGMRSAQIAAVLPPAASLAGLALDIGTTKIAAYLVDLESGKNLARGGMVNPQVAYGEDVVSRIAYANQNPAGRETLQELLTGRINELAAELCREAGLVPAQIVEAVVVANTAIHHLFTGLPVRQLGEAPYVPAVTDALEIPALDLGLKFASGAQVYLPQNIAGYVGADHVAMLLAIGMPARPGIAVALDIGTNTEISLHLPGKRLLTCSCASGPAFEGAHIQDGMRAVPGAIERLQIRAGRIRLQTVEQAPAIGLCGSGILDAVAELRRTEVLDRSGRIRKDAPGVRPAGGGGEVLILPAEESGHGHDIVVTRRDVNEIQLAKGAIRAGIETLLWIAGVKAERLDEIIIAGAFGTYLDIESALRIGMFPALPPERFHQVGNAAGLGARQLLVSRPLRREAEKLAAGLDYVELTAQKEFQDIYVEALTI